MNARLQKNSVNDGNIKQVKFCMGIFSFNEFFCVNNPSEACEVVETLYL